MEHPGKGYLLFFIKLQDRREEDADKQPAWPGVCYMRPSITTCLSICQSTILGDSPMPVLVLDVTLFH